MPLTDDERRQLHRTARQELAAARRSRYPVLLLLGVGDYLQPDLWREFAQSNGLAYLDILEQAAQPQFRREVGAWPTLVDWVRAQAIAHGGVLVVELDTLVTRWPEPDRQRFYLKLLKSETRTQPGDEAAPIVALSRLAYDYDLPREDPEYGRVVDLLD